MESNIVEELKKTKKIRNIVLAEKIKKRMESNTFRIPQDAIIEIKNKEKAYKLFNNLLSDKSKKELNEAETTINNITGKIYRHSGWWMTGENGFAYENNYINMRDHEFRSFDSYRIYRNEEGFYVSDQEPFNSYFARIKEKEISFYEHYKEELQVLHEALSKKENIMIGNYELKDEKNRSLADEISKFLGYKKETQEQVKKYIK